MKSKIAYFMEKDSRLIVDNLTKIVVNENLLIVYYTILRRNLKDEKTTVVRYLRDKNRLIIYDKLKEYNPIVYQAFIEWADEQGIECVSIGDYKVKQK